MEPNHKVAMPKIFANQPQQVFELVLIFLFLCFHFHVVAGLFEAAGPEKSCDRVSIASHLGKKEDNLDALLLAGVHPDQNARKSPSVCCTKSLDSAPRHHTGRHENHLAVLNNKCALSSSLSQSALGRLRG